MDTKEASLKFKKSTSEIRKCAREGLIPKAYKEIKWVIPDDTIIILNKKEIESIILNIIEFKTGISDRINIKGIRDYNGIRVILDLLNKLEYINFNDKIKGVEKLFKDISLTSKSLKFIYSEKKYNSIINIPLNINIIKIK